MLVEHFFAVFSSFFFFLFSFSLFFCQKKMQKHWKSWFWPSNCMQSTCLPVKIHNSANFAKYVCTIIPRSPVNRKLWHIVIMLPDCTVIIWVFSKPLNSAPFNVDPFPYDVGVKVGGLPSTQVNLPLWIAMKYDVIADLLSRGVTNLLRCFGLLCKRKKKKKLNLNFNTSC